MSHTTTDPRPFPPPRRGRGRPALVFLAILAALPTSLPAAEPAPRISTALSHPQVYEGQALLYRVTLHNVDDKAEPELGNLDDFDVTPLGPRTMESRQVKIINGQREETLERTRQYDYRLVPRKTGTLKLPAPSVKTGGQVLKGDPKTLRVLPAEAQDVVVAEITADRTRVYPMQPFTITLSVAVKGLPEPYAKRDPLSVQTQPAALQIPWASDNELPKGLEPQSDQDRWLSTLRPDNAAGFSINNFRRRTVFSLLGDEPMSFTGRTSQVKRRDKDGKEVVYWQYVYPRRFVARRPGTYGFGPAVVQGTFATRHAERGLLGEEIYALARRIEVVAADAPQEGRPATFCGAIGRFELSAELEPKRVRIGDPMTLTLTLRGEGTLETVQAPELTQIKEIADHFRVFEATEERKPDLCRFTYSLRPTQPGTKTFPGVTMACFDIESEKYVTLRTTPIAVEVVEAARLSSDQIVSTPRASGAQDELEAQRKGIFANVTDLAALRDESVRPGRWLLGLGALAGLYAIAALAIVRFHRLAGDRPLVRRRQAAGRARRQLARAGQLRAGADAVQEALVGLVADVADLAEAGLTTRDVCTHLRLLGVPDELTTRVGRLLDACDAARYAALDQDTAALGAQAQAVLDELIRTLKANQRFR